jgi:hypothetical protein
MAETIKLDPSAVSLSRTEVDITPFIAYEGINWGDAALEAAMADLSVGSSPVYTRLPNRQVSIPLRLRTVGGTTYDSIVATLQQKAGLFQGEGGWILRQVDATPIYADIENAVLHLGGSTLAAFNDVDVDAVLQLECLPDFYGSELTTDTSTVGGDNISILKVSGSWAVIQGSTPSRCRILITDASSNAQHGVIWGFRSRYYSAATTAALKYEAEELKAIAPAASGALTGASSGSAVTYGTLGAGWSDILGMQMADNSYLTHLGVYRVWARVYTTAAASLQLAWTYGTTLPYTINDPIAIPNTSAFYLVDLGVIQLNRMPFASSVWYGKIQGATTAGAGNTSIDKVWFQPLSEGAGKLSVPYASGYVDAVVASNSLTEIRTDGCFRQSSANWGPVGMVTGKMPRIPVSGVENRVVELFVKTTRGDFGSGNDGGIDNCTVQVKYRPSYLYRP